MQKMCLNNDLKDDTIFLAVADSPNTLNSTLKHCPIMLMGFPSLSSMEGVGEFGNSPLDFPPVGRAVIPGGP